MTSTSSNASKLEIYLSEDHSNYNLPKDQSKVLCEQNVTQSPIYTLPPEILSLIFQYACPPLTFDKRYGIYQKYKVRPERRFQFVLGAVSAYWRQVAFSTPQLWTSVDITVRPTAVEHASEILRTCLASSGSLPMSLGFEFVDGQAVEGPYLPNTPECSHQIQELHLRCPPESWINHLALLYPNLVRLSISKPSEPPSEDDVSLDIACSHISLYCTTMRFRVRSAAITTLHLRELQEDVCLELLMECVNLVEFRSLEPTSDIVYHAIPLPTSLFTLSHLKVFEWSLHSLSTVDQAMLQHVHMPALETLVWVEEDGRNLDASDPRTAFFDRLPSTLSALHLHNRVHHLIFSSATNNLIHKSPNVEYLLTRNCHEACLNPLLKDLTIDDGIAEPPVSLPKLNTIVIHESCNPPLERIDFDACLRMVQSRFYRCSQSPAQQSLRLEIIVELGQVDWPAQFKESMKELVRQGLILKITEEMVPVDWL